MKKYRIIQVAPEGFIGVYQVEYLMHMPTQHVVNPIYRYSKWDHPIRVDNASPIQTLYDKRNLELPDDFYEIIPARDVWVKVNKAKTKDNPQGVGNALFSSFDRAEEEVSRLQRQDKLIEQFQTFKPQVIKEYE